MSRIGRAPIEIPAGVTVTVGEDNLVKVKGPKGELSRQISPEMKVTIDNGVLTVERPSDDKTHRSLHGLSRTLINNMVVGVTEGYQKNLEIAGVGYRAQKQGKNLNLSLGFSHPVVVEPPEGITFDVPTATSITVSGIDKEVVGQIAAEIRSFREPEPYKGKGIKYAGEHIRRKEGKAGAKGKK
jgi:large subunit ribosomal protein L6